MQKCGQNYSTKIWLKIKNQNFMNLKTNDFQIQQWFLPKYQIFL